MIYCFTKVAFWHQFLIPFCSYFWKHFAYFWQQNVTLTMYDLADKVKKLRLDNKMERSEFAEVLHLDSRTLEKIERGEREMSLKEIDVVCSYFKIDPQVFIFGESKLVFENCNHNGVMVNNHNLTYNSLDEFQKINTELLQSKDEIIKLKDEMIALLKAQVVQK
jgi:transcriptional regulator with XRE-family HTH domain